MLTEPQWVGEWLPLPFSLPFREATPTRRCGDPAIETRLSIVRRGHADRTETAKSKHRVSSASRPDLAGLAVPRETERLSSSHRSTSIDTWIYAQGFTTRTHRRGRNLGCHSR